MEKEIISSCKEKLKDHIDLKCALDYEGSQDDISVPNRKAKHRVPRTFSVCLIQSRRKTFKEYMRQDMSQVMTDSSEDEIQFNMHIEGLLQQQGEAAFGFWIPWWQLPIISMLCICSLCRVQFTDREQKHPQWVGFQNPNEQTVSTVCSNVNISEEKLCGCLLLLEGFRHVSDK